jgi:hypothetical protein
MVLHKNLLFVLLVFSIESVDATMPAGALVLAGRAATSLAARSAAMKIAPTVGATLFLTACHYSSIKELTDDVSNMSTELVKNSQKRYKQLRSKLSEKLGNVEFVDKKIEQNGGDNKAWVGGKAGDINHITNNYFGKRSFAEVFVEWLEKGTKVRAVGVGVATGVVGTSGVHYMLRSKFGATGVDQKPQVIVVQVPAATSLATASTGQN